MSVLDAERRRRAEYMKRWRKTNADAREDAKAAQRAYERALTRLKALHPRQFRRLQDEERAMEGLPPLGTLPVGRPRKPSDDAPTCRYLADPGHVCANSYGEPLREGQVCHAEAAASLRGGDAA